MRITRRQLRRLINEAINEHRIKPALPGHISADHVSKIHSLIDGGSYDQARSIIDALGGSPDYVDNYIEYGEVGDLEKLGNETADLFEPMNQGSISFGAPREFKPDFDYDDMFALDDKATALSRDKREKARDSGITGFELEDVYDTHIERYFGNRNRPVRGDMFLESYDPAALSRTRELYDMINVLQVEAESIQSDLAAFIEEEVRHGYSDPSTARYDYEDMYPDKMQRLRYIEMTIEDAYAEIESLGDLPYD